MKGILALLLVLAVACGAAFAVIGNTATISAVRTTGVVLPTLQPIANNTSSSPSGINTALIGTLQATSISPAVSDLILKSGPYAYLLIDKNVEVFDTSKLKTISTIKPSRKDGSIDAVAVSPDSKYVYIAEHWSEYYSEANYETYIHYVNIVRLNASTLQPIDYFKFEDARPRHLAASPDGKVYFGYQKGSYPENGRFAIMDFSQGKSWNKEYNSLIMLYNFEFSPDSKHAYYSAWWDCPKFYDYDVPGNTIHLNWLTTNCSDYHQYARSVALAKNGQTLYTMINRGNGIVAMNTADKSEKLIATDYTPVTLTASKDGEQLYVIGYFLNSESKPVYIIHKYGGLKPIDSSSNGLLGALIFPKDAFAYDSLSYVTAPDGSYPSHMETTADGKFGFIATSEKDDAQNTGKGVIIYDLQYMNQVKTISGKMSQHDVAVASEKIIFSPPVDYSWAKQFANTQISGLSLLDGSMYVKKFYPEPNQFAKYYKEDFFEVYADFTDDVDNSTVSNSTFRLAEKSGAVVPGRTVVAGKIAIYAPYAQLKDGTDYVAYLSKSIKSKDGKPLYADVSWNFTTKNGTGEGSSFGNSTLNFTGIGAFSIGSALQIALVNETGSGNGSKLNPGRYWNWTLPSENGTGPLQQGTPETQGSQNIGGQGSTGNSGQQGNQNGGGQAQGSGTQTPSPELNPQPEPPIGNGQASPELNPQPEPPIGNGQSSPALNPQPEPPAPSFLDGIVNFFKQLFGMQ